MAISFFPPRLLLPARQYLLYSVQKVIRAAADLTFNKVASLVIARVAIFKPRVKVPDYRELIKDMPSHGAATQTYQFNLANTLVPMTREQAIAARLPPDTFNIVSGKRTLGSVQYQSWQDGGVFVVRGAFPIDLFLVFLNEVVPDYPRRTCNTFVAPACRFRLYCLSINDSSFKLSLFLNAVLRTCLSRERRPRFSCKR